MSRLGTARVRRHLSYCCSCGLPAAPGMQRGSARRVLLQDRLRGRRACVALWGRPGIRRVLPRLPTEMLASGASQGHPACRAAGCAAAWESLPGARLCRRGCHAALWAEDALCVGNAEPTRCRCEPAPLLRGKVADWAPCIILHSHARRLGCLNR